MTQGIVEFDARSGLATGRIRWQGKVYGIASASSTGSLSSVGTILPIANVAGLGSVGKAYQLYNLTGDKGLTGTPADGFTILRQGRPIQISAGVLDLKWA